MVKISEFTIKGLHGYKDFNIKFKDNTLILVGENGSGKTSVLRIFYYFITCQWQKLRNIYFESANIIINDKEYKVEHSNLIKYCDYLDESKKYFKYHNFSLSREMEIEHENDYDYEIEIPDFLKLDNSDYSSFFKLFHNNYKKTTNYFENLTENIKKSIDIKILYLPTYRCIEQELSSILASSKIMPNSRRKNFRFTFNNEGSYFLELIQFGMSDVKKAKDNILNNLKEFERTELNKLTLEYLSDVVNQKYINIDINKIQNTPDDIINNLLNRIDDKLLDTLSKNRLNNTILNVKQNTNKDEYDYHTQIICHYVIKLLDFQNKLEEKERNIKEFCKVCNKYITDKEFVYESSDFSFLIRNKYSNDINIEFQNLSSGEKQIVSLFSQLYLTDEQNYFVIIDEPELSLSVVWQKDFLVDIKAAAFCKGLFAVTHSPFIYNNELKDLTYGLGEFSR